MISVLQGLDGSLVGCLVGGQSVIWLVGWLVGCLVGGQSVVWLVGWSVHRLLSWPVGNSKGSLAVINQHSH